MVSSLFIEFTTRCMKAKVVPAEREINAFLMSVDRMDLYEYFVKNCFYNWSKITNNIRISNNKYI